MTIIYFAMGGGQGPDVGGATMVKMLRLLRLSRMARMARLLRSMPEILILLKGISAAIRSVFFTLVLLLILLYIFAVLFRQLADDTTTGKTYFSTVPGSMNKLLIHGIFFDNFGDMIESIVKENGALGVVLLFFFYSFVLLASLTVMNMLIGVLCEVVSAVAETEQEELTMIFLKDSLWTFVKDKAAQVHHERSTDTEGDGYNVIISKANFKDIMEDERACKLLRDVEVDIFALVDLVDTIFSTDHGEEKFLTYPEFVEVMLEHRSTSEATVKDITDLRRYIRARVDRMDEDMASKLKRMQAHVNAMSTLIEKVAGVETGTLQEEAKKDLQKLEEKLEKEAKAGTQKVGKWQTRKMKLNNKNAGEAHRPPQDMALPGRKWTKMSEQGETPMTQLVQPAERSGHGEQTVQKVRSGDSPKVAAAAGGGGAAVVSFKASPKGAGQDLATSSNPSSGRDSKVSDTKKSKTPSLISDTE